jgi:hypothetical protein
MSTINQCKNTIHEEYKHKYYNNKLSFQNIHTLIKLHKTSISIRPIKNRTNTTAYPLATQLSALIRQHIRLPNSYNVNNRIQVISELQSLHINHNTRISSFDISNMFTNIPTQNTIQIMQDILQRQEAPHAVIYDITD